MSRVARSAFVSTPGLNLPLASRRRGVVTPRAARPDRRPENAPGDFFVDHTCIDCDACRWIAPDTFTRVGGHVRGDDATPRREHARHRPPRASLVSHLEHPPRRARRRGEARARRLPSSPPSLRGRRRPRRRRDHVRELLSRVPPRIPQPFFLRRRAVPHRPSRRTRVRDGGLPRWTPSLAARLRRPGALGPVSPSSSRTKTTSPTTTDGRRRWTSRGCYTRTI